MQAGPTGVLGVHRFLVTRNSTNPYPYIRLSDYAIIVWIGHEKTGRLSSTGVYECEACYPKTSFNIRIAALNSVNLSLAAYFGLPSLITLILLTRTDSALSNTIRASCLRVRTSSTSIKLFIIKYIIFCMFFKNNKGGSQKPPPFRPSS